jgi:predicted metal-dependent peptidase
MLPVKFQEELVEARVYCNIATPLFSYMLYKCNIGIDNSIPTAAAKVLSKTNDIVFNEKFWDSLTGKERAFLLLHETLHIFLQHGTRLIDKAYNAMLWNIATDYHINYVLSGMYKENGYIKINQRYTEYLRFIKGGLLDERFVGMSSDEIYDLLLEEADGDPDKAVEKATGSNGDAYDEVYATEADSSAQETENAQSAIAAVQNAQMIGDGGIGDNELGISRIFKNLAEHKVKWQDILAETIRSSVKIRETYSRVSRKSRGGVIFPTYTGNSVNLVLGIDTSGSVSDGQLNEFVSEIRGIMHSFDSYTVDIITCDTSVYQIGQYTQDTPFDAIDWIKMAGGGGTRMKSMVNYAQNRLQDESAEDMICVIFTDGYLYKNDVSSEDFDGELIVCISGNDKMEFDDGVKKISIS